MLGHLSSDCNTADLAISVISRKLSELGHENVDVECAERARPIPLQPATRISPEITIEVEEKPAKTSRVCEPSAPEQPSDLPNEWQQTEWAF